MNKIKNQVVQVSGIIKKLFFLAMIILLNGCSQNQQSRLNYQDPSIVVHPNFSYSQYYRNVYSLSDFVNTNGRNMFSNDPSLFIVKPDVGYLMVHAYNETPHPHLKKENHNEIIFLPYRIYQSDGQIVEKISSSQNSPGIIGLPIGEYVVVIHTYNSQTKSFLVNIKPGMITEIDQSVLTALANK